MGFSRGAPHSCRRGAKPYSLRRKRSPALRPSQLASSISGGFEGAGKRATWSMIEEKVARLRRQSEHCRSLALGVNDDRTIAILLAMALEYDEKADGFEINTIPRWRAGRLS